MFRYESIFTILFKFYHLPKNDPIVRSVVLIQWIPLLATFDLKAGAANNVISTAIINKNLVNGARLSFSSTFLLSFYLNTSLFFSFPTQFTTRFSKSRFYDTSNFILKMVKAGMFYESIE